MRRLLVHCVGILGFLLPASRPLHAGPCSPDKGEAPGIYVPDRGCYELGIGYAYQHLNVLGSSFHTQNYNANISMHLFDWLTGAAGRLTFGAEAATNAGFGGKTSGNPSLDVKSFFIGAGPHLAIESGSRFTPWMHGLVGWERLRFTQTTTLGSSSALGFMVGGGVDFRLAPRVSWRVAGDYLGTDFQSSIESNYAVGTGLVFHF